MKKIVVFLAALATSFQLHALYQGNPANPGIIDEGCFLAKDAFMCVKAGYQRDQVFDRKLKANGRGGSVKNVQQLYDQGVLTLNFMDRLEVFGSAGAMEIFVNDHQFFPEGPYQLEFQTKNGFTWGAGVRADIIDWNNTSLGANANYQYAHPHVRWNTSNGVPAPNTSKIRWKEWQVGLALSHHVDIFTPYIGANYSRVYSQVQSISSPTSLTPVPTNYPKRFKMRSRHCFGLALGCDLSTGKVFDLGVELRMISELAITLKGDIKF